MIPDSDYTMTIDGQAVTTERHIGVINPATGEVFAQAPDASATDLDRAVSSATVAFKLWKKRPWDERAALLFRAGELIVENAESLGRLFTREQGRPTDGALQEAKGTGEWLKAISAMTIPIEVTQDGPKQRVEVHHEPLGVVAAIVPWNFPLLLAAWKIAPALLAGNTMVLKPSPYTPLSTLKMGELLRGVLPRGVLNVISGGDALGPMMTSHKGFAKISFTGSTATGKRVMESAAKDLKRLTLELGGNDAAIVLPDVDLDKVAQKIFFGAFWNSAQICVATKRLYVHTDIYDGLRDRLHAIAKAIKVGDGAEQGTVLGPIQNEAQYRRVLALMEHAKASGLTLLQGAAIPEGRGYFIPVTIVDNPPEESRVVTEEAFGPILPMLRFDDIDDVIDRANNSEYGLAGAVWAKDVSKAVDIAHRLDTGTVWINQNLTLLASTPFGGRKQSGIGVENGQAGLLEFTQTKTIYIPK
jgi:acyl-CoA reductase-like NAD-dependent aldehyde dehydrogenase